MLTRTPGAADPCRSDQSTLFKHAHLADVYYQESKIMDQLKIRGSTESNAKTAAVRRFADIVTL